MTMHHFTGFKGRASHKFTCPACEKPNRTRTFTVEHTVNPFNKNDDGTVRTSAQVMARAQKAAVLERDQFATEPLCAKCEDSLPWRLRGELMQRRRAAVPEVAENATP